LKAVYQKFVSTAETIGAFNTGFNTLNMHRPAKDGRVRERFVMRTTVRARQVVRETLEDLRPTQV
jgi:hypothetical protein